MPSFDFKVTIKCGNKEIPITKQSRLIQRVIEWYKIRFEFLSDFYEVKITSFSFNYEKECFNVKFIEMDGFEEEPHLDELMTDPDDDGNYPIKAYGTECIVIGQVV